MSKSVSIDNSKANPAEWLRTYPDVMIGAGLALLTVLARLPFQSQVLYHWDSVNFAFALDRFDIEAGQPHVPGYILYVLLGQMVNALVGDPQTTLVLISVIASALAVAALYLLGRDLFSRATGLAAALLLASSPLFWFYGEIALPHTLDTLMVVLSVWLLYRIMKGDRTLVWPAAVALGVAGGLRPQTLLFLAPLALFAGRKLDLKRAVGGVAVLGVVCLAWFIPLVMNVGGLDRYSAIMGAYTASFNFLDSSAGLARNLRKLVMYTLYGGLAALLPAVVYAVAWLRRLRPATLARRERFWFLVIAAGPSLLFYTVVHMGQQGLIFVYLPALLLAGAEGLRRLTAKADAKRFTALLAVLIAANAAIFLLAPTYPLGEDSFKLLTWRTVQDNDAYYRSRFDAIQASFSPENTVVMASNWRHVQYYLPGYRRVADDIAGAWAEIASAPLQNTSYALTAEDISVLPDAERPATVILFDPELANYAQNRDALDRLDLADGDSLYSLTLDEGDVLRIDIEGIRLERPAS